MPTFQEGCYTGLSCLFIHYSHAHSRNIYFQHKQGESHISNTGCVPVAEMNVYSWQDTHWSCSSDTTEIALTRSSHQYAQVCSFGHPETILVARRQFLGRKRIEQWPFPWLMCKDIGWTEAVLVVARKQAKKKKKPLAMRIVCEHLGVDHLKDLGNRKKTVASGNCVLLEIGKFQTSSICTVGEMKKSGKYNSELLQEHLKTEFQSRTLPCTWEQDVSGFPVPGTVLQPRQPHLRGRCIQPLGNMIHA